MTALVSTVGTSLITNCFNRDRTTFTAADGALVRQYANTLTTSPDIDALLLRVEAYLAAHPDAYLDTAEMNPIYKYLVHARHALGHTQLDMEYIFVTTCTVFGEFCAQQLTRYVKQNMVNAEVSMKSIPQLQIQNPDELDAGWRNLREELDDIHTQHNANVIYNITGGYKLLSGLVQGYASNRGAPVIYTYEGDSQLVVIAVNARGMNPEVTFFQNNPVAYHDRLLFLQQS